MPGGDRIRYKRAQCVGTATVTGVAITWLPLWILLVQHATEPTCDMPLRPLFWTVSIVDSVLLGICAQCSWFWRDRRSDCRPHLITAFAFLWVTFVYALLSIVYVHGIVANWDECRGRLGGFWLQLTLAYSIFRGVGFGAPATAIFFFRALPALFRWCVVRHCGCPMWVWEALPFSTEEQGQEDETDVPARDAPLDAGPQLHVALGSSGTVPLPLARGF